jgi:hypothetical protein
MGQKVEIPLPGFPRRLVERGPVLRHLPSGASEAQPLAWTHVVHPLATSAPRLDTCPPVLGHRWLGASTHVLWCLDTGSPVLSRVPMLLRRVRGLLRKGPPVLLQGGPVVPKVVQPGVGTLESAGATLRSAGCSLPTAGPSRRSGGLSLPSGAPMPPSPKARPRCAARDLTSPPCFARRLPPPVDSASDARHSA